MSIQFVQDCLDEVNEEIRNTRDRVRVFELGVIRMYLINKQNQLDDEMAEFAKEDGYNE
jgi:hypothetical protein